MPACPFCGGDLHHPSKVRPHPPAECKVDKWGWKQHVFTAPSGGLYAGCRCACGEEVIKPGEQVVGKNGGYTVRGS